MAQVSGNPDLIAAFPPGTLGCWVITEPDHGSDVIHFARPARAPLIEDGANEVLSLCAADKP